MKRKNTNVLKPEYFFNLDKSITRIYFKLRSILVSCNKKNSFAIAVSGGPDSMALVALSDMLKLNENLKFYYLLVDHGIRKGSNKEAKKIKKILKDKKIQLKIIKIKKKINKNVQKTARDLRYEVLRKFCKENKIKFLITAHHKDDQVETFFIRLSRGSGIEGLSSMNEMTNIGSGITLVRPFLEFHKKELNNVTKKYFKKSIKDPSNQNKKFLRTNVRDLLKILQKRGLNFNQIIRSIDNIKSSKETLNFYLEKSLKHLAKFNRQETILDLKKFKKEPKEIKFKIVNKIVKNRSGSYYPPRSKKVLSLIARFENNSHKKCTLGGCIFERKKNLLYVTKEV